MTNTSGEENTKTEGKDEDGDEWVDFEIIISHTIQKIGIIRYLEEMEDDGAADEICEFFSSVKVLYDMAGELYASYILHDSTCVYCGREPRSDWDDEERHDDIVFFEEDGKTATAHRFCRSEAIQNESLGKTESLTESGDV